MAQTKELGRFFAIWVLYYIVLTQFLDFAPMAGAAFMAVGTAIMAAATMAGWHILKVL